MVSVRECLGVVERLYREGRPVREIVQLCGNSVSTVYEAVDILVEQGRLRRRRRRYRRVTEEERWLITHLYWEKGATVSEIARATGRSRATIRKIITQSEVVNWRRRRGGPL